MKNNPWRSRLLFLGAFLIIIGIPSLPFGLIGFVFGIYCIQYGLRLKPTCLPDSTQKSRIKVQSQVSTPKPPLPKKELSEYEKRVEILQELETKADKQLASMTEYLNQLFADSEITRTRYLSIVRKAESITDVNLIKARNAIELFGDGPVSEQRLEILDGYVQSSREMLTRIDGVVTELMRAEQSDQLRTTKSVEEAMNELRDTAKYYTS